MAQRMWDGSGFYTHITSPALSEDCAVDRNHRLEFYRAVLLELNPDKLWERVKAAEEAIRARASLNGEILSDERVAIENRPLLYRVTYGSYLNWYARYEIPRFAVLYDGETPSDGEEPY
jgi:hypothetical protein